MESFDFEIDTQKGEYICPNCGRRFPCFYTKKALIIRTMSRKLTGSANFYRRLRACYAKGMQLWVVK
jgi:hypothetical protein